jgi:hypothetical protein
LAHPAKGSRIERGQVLSGQFESAEQACRTDSKAAERQLAERINELAVAKDRSDSKLPGACQSVLTSLSTIYFFNYRNGPTIFLYTLDVSLRRRANSCQI